jgi:hypothetical protein
VLGIWAPSKQLAFAGGVLDPNSQSSNLANNAFDKVNLYFTAVASYDIAGLPKDRSANGTSASVGRA